MRAPPEPLDHAVGDGRGVARAGLGARAGALVVEPGEQQQVVDEPAQPVGVGEHVVGRRRPAVARPLRGCALRAPRAGCGSTASGLRSSWAASATNARCRRGRRVEPGQHAVEGDRQPADLVVRGGQRQRCPGRAASVPSSAGAAGAAPRPAAAPTRRATAEQRDAEHQQAQTTATSAW